MNKPSIHYDKASDTLYVSFIPGEKGTGIELNDHLLLRINSRNNGNRPGRGPQSVTKELSHIAGQHTPAWAVIQRGR